MVPALEHVSTVPPIDSGSATRAQRPVGVGMFLEQVAHEGRPRSLTAARDMAVAMLDLEAVDRRRQVDDVRTVG